MRKIYIALVIFISFIFLSQHMLAQDKKVIVLKPDWKAGDSREYLIVRSGEKYSKEGYEVTHVDTTAYYSYKVVSKDSLGYVLEFTSKTYGQHANTDAVQWIEDHLRYLFSVSPEGKYIELLNSAEIMNTYKKMRDSIAVGNMDGRALEEQGAYKGYSEEFNMDEAKAQLFCERAAGIILKHFGEQFYPGHVLSDKGITPAYILPSGISMVYFTKVLEASNRKLILEQTYHLTQPAHPSKALSETRTELFSYDRLNGWLERDVYRHLMEGKNAIEIELLELILQ